MPERACEVCGELFHQGVGRPAKRCPAHRTRYGAEHQQLRAATVDSYVGRPCARCGQPLFPPMDLDHDEAGGYLGYSHAVCNRRAGAARRNGQPASESVPLGTTRAGPGTKVWVFGPCGWSLRSRCLQGSPVGDGCRLCPAPTSRDCLCELKGT